MPYYLARIQQRYCNEEGCSRLASHELRRPDNGLMGWYCTPHGERRLEMWNGLLDAEVAEGRWAR